MGDISVWNRSVVGFSPDRKTVHQDLRQGKWKNISPVEPCDCVRIEDYMGLFEVCERMLERKIIDEDMFGSLYELLSRLEGREWII